MTDTFWNGERCVCRKLTAIVADTGQFPHYWARNLVGRARRVVEVNYNGVFYLDNEDGQGWEKVTVGSGSPRVSHRSLEIERVLA